MSANCFLDTNILLYSFDTASPEKKARAIELIKQRPFISSQVINEFINVSLKKRLYTHTQLEMILRDLDARLPLSIRSWLIQQHSPHSFHQRSFYVRRE